MQTGRRDFWCSRRGPASPPPLLASLRPRASSVVTTNCGPTLYDLAFASLPVAVAQQALVELARRMTRQLGLEIDAARALDGREVLAAERQKFLGQRRAGIDHAARLDDRLHFFAEVGIGHAEHGA